MSTILRVNNWKRARFGAKTAKTAKSRHLTDAYMDFYLNLIK